MKKTLLNMTKGDFLEEVEFLEEIFMKGADKVGRFLKKLSGHKGYVKALGQEWTWAVGNRSPERLREWS